MWYRVLCKDCGYEWEVDSPFGLVCDLCGCYIIYTIAGGIKPWSVKKLTQVTRDGEKIELYKEKSMELTCTDVNKFGAIKEAFKQSIDKWELVANEGAVDRGVEDCALCHTFGVHSVMLELTHTENHPCTPCPVRQKTGRNACAGTPYGEWKRHQYGEHQIEAGFVVKCPICHDLALNFKEWLMELFIECIDNRMVELQKELEGMYNENQDLAEQLALKRIDIEEAERLEKKKADEQWENITDQIHFTSVKDEEIDDCVTFHLYRQVMLSEKHYTQEWIGKLFEGKLELSDNFKNKYLTRAGWEGEDFRLAVKKRPFKGVQ